MQYRQATIEPDTTNNLYHIIDVRQYLGNHDMRVFAVVGKAGTV